MSIASIGDTLGFHQRKALSLALLGVLWCAACDDTSSGTAQTSVSANKPADKPSSLVIPVEEKPAAEEAPVAKKPKKKPEDCPSGTTLSFDSPELEQGIRFKLQKMEGDLTQADLRRLTSLKLTDMKVHELDVCLFPHMVNLKELFLGPGDLDDLSPIAELKNLETLVASINQVSDITPLTKMTKMDRLDLGRTKVKDLSPLAGMTKMTELQLDSTPVEDLSPLSNMKDLETLSIKKTQVKDVAPLAGLTKLKFLYVADTPADEDPMSFAPLRSNGTKVINM